MRRPVNEPGPMEMWSCCICAGVRLKRLNRCWTVGKSSPVCVMGAEKVDSASRLGPSARATVPTLLEVSTANISGVGVMSGTSGGIGIGLGQRAFSGFS